MACLLAVLSTAALGDANAATLVLDALVPSLTKQPVTVDYEFVGLVGDPILLADGSHSIQIKGEHEQSLRVSVAVQGTSLRVKGVGTDYEDCSAGPVWSVAGWSPTVASAPDGNGFLHMGLPDPPYKQTGASTNCAASSMAAIPQSLVVGVKSVPTGSDIYVDGTLAGHSDTTLSIPYYSNERSRGLLVRHDGYFPCKREVILASPPPQSVTCVLKPVPQSR